MGRKVPNIVEATRRVEEKIPKKGSSVPLRIE
jgi:hypothetical protein